MKKTACVIRKENFGDGASLFSVSSGSISAYITNFGCTVTNIFVPDKNGNLVDVLLGYDDFLGWKNGTGAHNAVVGRFANRISGAKFELNGRTFNLDLNGKGNCIHGGFDRYEKKLWNAEIFEKENEAGLIFTRLSPAGEQKFPGNLDLKVIYTLNDRNQLCMEYFASTDEDTPVNLTNHAYFNLNGKGDVLNHYVQLECSQLLECVDMIPNGRFLDVETAENGIFDFRKPKKIGKDVDKISPEIKGYDHCFVTLADETETVKAASCWSEESGIKMNVYTNQRGLQLYSGNWLDGVKGKSGVIHKGRDGICFEAQRFPDSPNRPEFPDCILRPGKTYYQKTIYEFGRL